MFKKTDADSSIFVTTEDPVNYYDCKRIEEEYQISDKTKKMI